MFVAFRNTKLLIKFFVF